MRCRNHIPESVLVLNHLKRSDLISCKAEAQITYVEMPVQSGSTKIQHEYLYRLKDSGLPLASAPSCSSSTQNIQFKSGNSFVDIVEPNFESFTTTNFPGRVCKEIEIQTSYNAPSIHGSSDSALIADQIAKPLDFIPQSKRAPTTLVIIKSPSGQMNAILNAIAAKLTAKGITVYLIDKNENALITLEEVKQKLAVASEKIASTLNNLINKPANCAEVLAVKVNSSTKQFKVFGDAADKIELIDHSPQFNDQIKLTCRVAD